MIDLKGLDCVWICASCLWSFGYLSLWMFLLLFLIWEGYYDVQDLPLNLDELNSWVFASLLIFSLFLVPAVLISLLALPPFFLMVYFSDTPQYSVSRGTVESCRSEKLLLMFFRFVPQREAETGNGSVCCLPSIFVTTVKTWKCHRGDHGSVCRRLLWE